MGQKKEAERRWWSCPTQLIREHPWRSWQPWKGAHTPLTALIRGIPGLQTTLAISPLSLPLLLHRSALSVISWFKSLECGPCMPGLDVGVQGPPGEGDGTPLQSSCLENPTDEGAWWAAVHGVVKSQTQLGNFAFPFHFHALEKEMETHSSVLAWRIPGMGEPGGLPSMGSHRVQLDWSDLAAANLLGGPVAEIPRSQCRGLSYILHATTKDSTCCREDWRPYMPQ